MDFIQENWQTLFSGIGTEVVIGAITILVSLVCFFVKRSKPNSTNKVKMNNIQAGGHVSGRDTRN